MIEWSGEDIESLNKKLVDNYGLDIGLGIPKFRLVWSTTARETRYSEYEVFSESGDIYLRTEKGVEKDVPKYPLNEDMWVLEQIQSTAGNPYLEMVAKWSYEPLWIFGVGNSDRRPVWRGVQLLVQNRLFGDPNSRPKSPTDLIREEAERMRKEKSVCLDIIKNDSPYMASCLEGGQAVTVLTDHNKGLENASSEAV